MTKTIWLLIILFLIFSLAFYFVPRVFYFPSLQEHVERNKHNKKPTGKLLLIDNEKNLYQDEANVIWYRRPFWKSVCHHPFENYVLEEYNEKSESSSEVEIKREDLDRGVYHYKTATFNYYSSIFHPLRHVVADVLPSIFYMASNYKVFD
jgi:hypothetical protein